MASSSRRKDIKDAFEKVFSASPIKKEYKKEKEKKIAEPLQITDQQAVDQIKKIHKVRQDKKEYIKKHIEPVLMQLKAHELRLKGIDIDRKVHAQDFWERLHDLRIIDQSDDIVYTFDYEDRDGEVVKVSIQEQQEESSNSEEIPDIVRYLLKSLEEQGFKIDLGE